MVTLLDPSYPPQLPTIHQRLPFLFYRCRLDSRAAARVAIVGARKPAEQGLSRASAIATGLAERGVMWSAG